MLDELSLYKKSVTGGDYCFTENIIIRNPTLNDISDFGEQKYYGMVTALCSNPSLYKVPLWDMGIDWTNISDFDFFCMICTGMSLDETSILLGDLDLSKLKLVYNPESKENRLELEKDGISIPVIDRAIYMELSRYVRHMHCFENKIDGAANEHTKRWKVEREKERMARHKNDKHKSMLKPLISGMINTPGFKYDYKSVWDLTISAFNDSVRGVQKYMTYTQTMQGVYAGTIDTKSIDFDKLNWLN